MRFLSVCVRRRRDVRYAVGVRGKLVASCFKIWDREDRGRGARAQRMEASVAAPQVRLESFAREREREGDARGRLEREKMRDEVD